MLYSLILEVKAFMIHYYLREIWNTDKFESYEMSFSSYTEPLSEEPVESGCFVAYRTRQREWADDVERLVAISKYDSVRSDGYDPIYDYIFGDTYIDPIFDW